MSGCPPQGLFRAFPSAYPVEITSARDIEVIEPITKALRYAVDRDPAIRPHIARLLVRRGPPAVVRLVIAAGINTVDLMLRRGLAPQVAEEGNK
jgi:hypothetical protein